MKIFTAPQHTRFILPPIHPTKSSLRCVGGIFLFWELLGARPLHLAILLRKTVPLLKSPTGAFIALLRFANAVPPQTLLRTDEEELCQIDTIPPHPMRINR